MLNSSNVLESVQFTAKPQAQTIHIWFLSFLLEINAGISKVQVLLSTCRVTCNPTGTFYETNTTNSSPGHTSVSLHFCRILLNENFTQYIVHVHCKCTMPGACK